MIYDVIVVGAGAAGLMTAIQAARLKLRVLLLDSREKIGAKILMSGGTRCNVTNFKVSERDFNGGNPRAIRNILSAFSSEKAVQFFEELGVTLIREEGGKYFPSTHSAKTVLDSLVNEVKKSGVLLETGKKVTRVVKEEDDFEVSGTGFRYRAKTVVLTTGGLSYPSSGSDGTGFEISKSLGHSLIPTSPALTPLLTDDLDLKKLTGLTLPVVLSLFIDGKKELEYTGSFLFTHFGFSGPAVLNMSRHWLRIESGKERSLYCNFLPHLTEQEFSDRLIRHIEKHPAQSVCNALLQWFPERFVEIYLKKTGISPETHLNQLKRTDRDKITRSFFHFELSVSGVYGYTKAEVTAGGVSLEEVDTKTMESKRAPGLFFAGEILDVDGRIGGFNFQWAWSSGTVVAKGIRKKLS